MGAVTKTTTRSIIHVDMDAFYASVEQRDRPELKGRPVIVGGHLRRGVVLAASYEVRPFGVRSAIPMARAIKLAPHAVVVPPRFRAYAEASDGVFSIFESVTPLIEPLSLDEAFLDVTGSTRLFGPPARIASHLRERIAREVCLPASAGIASTKFVAKIASDLAKPNGQTKVPAERTREFLAPLPVSRLWGVGPRTEETLHGLGLRTIGHIAASDPQWLERRLGSSGLHLWELSQGIDERPVVPDREAKSMGAEDTFEEDLDDLEALKAHVHSQAARVGRRLRRAGVKARVVQLKVKYSDFETITRRSTLEEPTDDGQRLYREALALFGRVPREKAIRLTGVSGQDLTTGGGGASQLTLFSPAPRRRDKLNAALDRIVERFGSQAVTTADLARQETRPDEEEEDRRALGASRLDADVARSKKSPQRE
ncbi:MAG: DNA polymerase IV [Deltaproteobacteria bacterium]|nr:DNA polymerase IV [Deltaproteobacteria bacterium]